MTMRNPRCITRRTLLSGVGVTMALPWLESLPVWGSEPPRHAASAAPPPKRFAALFMGNGISPKHWWAKGAGARHGAEQEPRAARAVPVAAERHLGPVQQAGDRRRHPSRPDRQHPLRRGAAEGRRAARRHQHRSGAGRATSARRPPQPSLVLGCEQPITGYHETNFSMAYSSHISWQDANSPVPMEVYPSLAFDSLFDNQGSQRTPQHSRPRQASTPRRSAARSATPTRPSSTST